MLSAAPREGKVGFVSYFNSPLLNKEAFIIAQNILSMIYYIWANGDTSQLSFQSCVCLFQFYGIHSFSKYL